MQYIYLYNDIIIVSFLYVVLLIAKLVYFLANLVGFNCRQSPPPLQKSIPLDFIYFFLYYIHTVV